jgi:hypothetical protein
MLILSKGVIVGRAALAKCEKVFVSDLSEYFELHLVGPEWIEEYYKGKTHAFMWYLSDPQVFEEPIAYPATKGGAMIWKKIPAFLVSMRSRMPICPSQTPDALRHDKLPASNSLQDMVACLFRQRLPDCSREAIELFARSALDRWNSVIRVGTACGELRSLGVFRVVISLVASPCLQSRLAESMTCCVLVKELAKTHSLRFWNGCVCDSASTRSRRNQPDFWPSPASCARLRL